jgi:hypothetical protein
MAVTLNANTSTGFIATSDTSGVLKLTSANNLVSQMANCGPNANKLTDYFHYQCTFSIPLR